VNPSSSSNLPQTILDALRAHIAVLDPEGVIVAVNRAWQEFAAENGATADARTGVGTNYLDVCRIATAHPDDAISSAAAYAAITAVLAGQQDFFEMEYPCHSSTTLRWFLLQIQPALIDNRRHAVVAHHDITRLYTLGQAVAPDAILSDDASLADEATPTDDATIADRLNAQEMTALNWLINRPTTRITGGMLGVTPLSDGFPDLFAHLARAYSEALDQAVEARHYKVRHATADQLRAVAERLGFSRAGPRDVVDIHTAALRLRLKSKPSQARAYLEEGRVLVLELMGYLASYYRNYALGQPPRARQEEGPPSQPS
jgi:hypothetical protein